ncbi:MAG: OmpA family protein [Gammaproteobacteria bacterium]|jgi:OmpA-OmpF porin, OOP family|nr:OmpA family protein [Gammaproteobacteria bacterium]MBT5222295.1 OmpA family protein [Gammaproteobacteria bacterium]MBT5825506.1 OmpA family protein [Gammaproteobacteria bacterium]MBT5967495.1 OmpA family protein [Gammaproteobacteria bacterium]MBT6419360.1 OmpA family protein [Gammaproteobacteria bacterium]
MLKKIIIPVVAISGLALLSGCATKPTTYPNFTATPVAQATSTSEFRQKTDAIFVIVDASSSTNTTYDGNDSGSSKLDVEKQTLYRLNKTIPANINLATGITSFGSGHCLDWSSTKVDQNATRHSAKNFQSGLDMTQCASGGSPLNKALAGSTTELEKVRGNSALLIVSDGQQVPSETLAEAQALEDKFGQRLCIYSIWVGNNYDTSGQVVLQELSNISNCGKSVNSADISSSAAMAGFVESMLYSKSGVTSRDSDADGIDDSHDKCKNTPSGAKVNSQGCWSFNSVDFGFDSTKITPAFAPLFENAIATLNKNPRMTVQLEGHTDSTGPEAYNMGLSVRRAEAVKNHLVENGIDTSRLTTKGFGESNPIAPNDTAKGRAENRRVGFTITAR